MVRYRQQGSVIVVAKHGLIKMVDTCCARPLRQICKSHQKLS